ncbi:LegC2/C7 family Dot/Icm T4SS effector [Legionella sp. km772]|uniref:LegC2/C7 family Dot/Icm T4SS effector n=1 Tax=Legionella sp. km772 TaxID=2498111 RepID=UPI000F8EBCB7|nr:LegC2/C7 family Dot/Icm T4SS effector [Legionella sp. km772]RUR07593.1 hypothetical protein ELY15_12025 [Legionella sp. km772]
MSTEIEELSNLLESAKTSVEPVKITVVPPKQAISLSAPAEIDNLAEIIKTRDNIAKVKESLNKIIDSIADNPSLVTRASNAWGEWATWQKVGTGLALTVPALLSGAAAGIGSLLILGGATGVVYTTTGIILEDHHACNENIKQRLKEGISSIADILELTIVALDNIRLRLAEEIGKFKEENFKLARLVSNLQDQVTTLSIHIEILEETETFLRGTKDKLQKDIEELKKSTEQQDVLLKKKQAELVQVTSDYQKTQAQLDKRIEELRVVREEMSIEITKTQKVSVVLQKAVHTLSGQVLEEQTQKQLFQRKLESLMTDKEADASKLLERMSTTHRELEGAKEDLRANNARNSELLAKQGELVKRLEKIDLMLLCRREPIGVRVSEVPSTLFNTRSTPGAVEVVGAVLGAKTL